MALPQPKICFRVSAGRRVWGRCERIERTAGIFPNRVELLCPIHEFEKLDKELLGVKGDLELFLRGDEPDVILKGWFLRDAQDTLPGRLPNETAQKVLEKRLILLDRRWEFADGLGGHTWLGKINQPDKDGQKVSADPPPQMRGRFKQEFPAMRAVATWPATTFQILKLLWWSLQCASGGDKFDTDYIPPELELKERGGGEPRDVDLSGHVPSLIQELLDNAGAVWVLDGKGEYRIHMKGAAPRGQPTEPLADQAKAPYVCITSSPTRAIVTETARGPGKALGDEEIWWEYAAQDTDGAWKPLSEISYVVRMGKQHNPIGFFTLFGTAAKISREESFNAQTQFYKNIRLAGPGRAKRLPLLARLAEAVQGADEGDKQNPLIQVEATRVWEKHPGEWVAGPARERLLECQVDPVNGVLTFPNRLLRLRSGLEGAYADYFWELCKYELVRELAPGAIHVTFSHECKEYGDHRDFFTGAWRYVAGRVEESKPDDALSPQTACRVIRNPALLENRRLVKGKLVSDNADQLKKAAGEMARRMLVNPEGCERRRYAGFWPVAVTGKTPVVVYDFNDFTTTVDWQTWAVGNRYTEKADMFRVKNKADKAQVASAAAPIQTALGAGDTATPPYRLPGFGAQAEGRGTFWADIGREYTGKGGKYDLWTEQKISAAGEWQAVTGGRNQLRGFLVEANGVEGIPVGTKVLVHVEHKPNGAIEYRFTYGEGAGMGNWAKMTAETDGVYTCKVAFVNNAGSWELVNPEITLTGVKEANGAKGLYQEGQDTYVFVHYCTKPDSSLAYRFYSGETPVVKFYKATENYGVGDDDTIEVNECDPDGGNVGEATITGYIESPWADSLNMARRDVKIKTGDVIAGLPFGENKAMLLPLPPNVPETDGQYMRTATVAESGVKTGFEWLKAQYAGLLCGGHGSGDQAGKFEQIAAPADVNGDYRLKCEVSGGEIKVKTFSWDDGGLPTPTTLYKVLAVCSDGEGGVKWDEDWVRAH
jgi:hypothetical protein